MNNGTDDRPYKKILTIWLLSYYSSIYRRQHSDLEIYSIFNQARRHYRYIFEEKKEFLFAVFSFSRTKYSGRRIWFFSSKIKNYENLNLSPICSKYTSQLILFNQVNVCECFCGYYNYWTQGGIQWVVGLICSKSYLLCKISYMV